MAAKGSPPRPRPALQPRPKGRKVHEAVIEACIKQVREAGGGVPSFILWRDEDAAAWAEAAAEIERREKRVIMDPNGEPDA